MPRYMVLVPASGSPFVKEREFFEEQGGFRNDWGKNWRPLDAESIEDARVKAAKLGPFFARLDRPTIVCLCGSTRFKDEFVAQNARLTMEGKIVLSVGFFGHRDTRQITEIEKRALDELHKRKIDLADEVFVLSVGGYVGDSTRSEIAYAQQVGKPVTYLEPITDWCGEVHTEVARGQPSPTSNDQPATWDLVLADIRERDQHGRQKYGTPLQPFNGRDSLRDLYEELLDAVVYARNRLAEETRLREVAGWVAAYHPDHDGQCLVCKVISPCSAAELARLVLR